MSQDTHHYQRIAAIFREHESFIVSAHIRADGDAIAALCFVDSLLKRLGKTVLAVLHDTLPDQKYSFLESFHDIRPVSSVLCPSDAILVLLDTPTRERMGDVAEWLLPQTRIINIDHHVSNTGFGFIDIVDAAASSTSEMLMQFWDLFPDLMDEKMAEMLFTGICFDTGRFRFSNTTQSTFRIAGRLVEAGVRPEQITEAVFYQWSLIHARTIGRALNNLQVCKQGKVAVMLLDHEFFAQNPDGWKEVEGISDLGTSIAGIEIALFFKEIEPQRFKVSLRSADHWDVGRIASAFGGGGHVKAAGCEIRGEFDSALRRLLAEIDLAE